MCDLTKISKKVPGILLILVMFTYLYTVVFSVAAEAENGAFRIKNKKNYDIVYHNYILDFESSNRIENSDGWKFTSANYAAVKDGKLVVNKNGFAVRSANILGDAYGAEETDITFDMTLAQGSVSVGVRLKSTVSTNDTGIWFTIGTDTVTVRAGGTELNEVITHDLPLETEHRYTIRHGFSWIRLYITEESEEQLVAAVKYEFSGNISVYDRDGGVASGRVKNVKTPQVGFWKMKFEDFQGSVDNIEYYSNEVIQKIIEMDTERPIDYSTWIASDDLDRLTPMNSEVGSLRNDKYVGLFYFLCHTGDREENVIDYTKMYLETGLEGLKSHLRGNSGGYWSEPYFGYYLSTDPWIYRKHAYMFSAAGIDFIFLDMSNGVSYPEQLTVLLDTWLQMRKEGTDTPQIVCHMGNDAFIMVRDLFAIWNDYLSKDKYSELWFRWEEKPLIFGNMEWAKGSSDRTVNNLNEKERQFYESGEFNRILDENFTVRKSWAWQATLYDDNNSYVGYWDWLDDWPQSFGRDFNGNPEQISVSVAHHVQTNRGRSWVNGNTDYGTGLEDFDFTLNTSRLGLCFAQQFEHAIEMDPKVIMITDWNEWVAARQEINNPDMRMAHTSTPNYYFVDQFNPEFSRDVEPMKLREGVGFGDNYYYQMVQYIRMFKGVDALPKAEGQKGISMEIDENAADYFTEVDNKIFSQWADVGPEYRDTVGDTVYRNKESVGHLYKYVNSTGRNDLNYAKVTQDTNSIYFLITTTGVLATADEETWMNLYLNTDQNYSTGWEGYDYVINRDRDGKTMSVERFVDENWKFETVGRAEYVMGTNNLTIKIAKDLIMLSGNEINLDFKWTDNSTDSGEIMQFMDLGDCAPNDRFNFRYSSTATGEGMTARPSLLNGPSAPLSIWKWVIIGGILAAGIGAVIVFISFRRRNTGSPNGKTYNKQK